jgi:hypothetical protein
MGSLVRIRVKLPKRNQSGFMFFTHLKHCYTFGILFIIRPFAADKLDKTGQGTKEIGV